MDYKINYVIATFEGKCNRKHINPLPKDILIEHLKTLLKLKHNLTQITIMKPKCNKEKIIEYYDIDNSVKQFNIPVKIIECENYGYSNGQWMKAYELDNSFDYYILMEDDYCFNMNNFDDKFIECYQNKFKNNIGHLSCYVEGRPKHKRHRFPEHFGGALLLSNKTWKKLYSFDKWNNNPRKYLDLMTNKYDKCFRKIRKEYLGGYYQVAFSFLFTYSGIKHDDILDKYDFIYWDDLCSMLICYRFKKKRMRKLKLYQYNKFLKTSLCIPVQKYQH